MFQIPPIIGTSGVFIPGRDEDDQGEPTHSINDPRGEGRDPARAAICHPVGCGYDTKVISEAVRNCRVLFGDWCNGSTADSGSASLGSNPRSPVWRTHLAIECSNPASRVCASRRTPRVTTQAELRFMAPGGMLVMSARRRADSLSRAGDEATSQAGVASPASAVNLMA